MTESKPQAIVWMLIANMCCAFILLVVGWPANSATCKIYLLLSGVFFMLAVWYGAGISHKLKRGMQ